MPDKTLRPYYDHDSFNAGYPVIFKSGVGLIDTTTNKPLSLGIITHAQSKGFLPGKGLGIHAVDGSVGKFGKNYAYDLEFNEYFDFNNLVELFKNLLWSFAKNYCKVLLSQPLDTVRLLLQVGVFNFKKTDKPKKQRRRLLDDDDELDLSSGDEINYFQSAPNEANEWGGDLVTSASTHSTTSKRKRVLQLIEPVSAHTMDVLALIASNEGPFGLFRGINAAFIYQTLSHTIEAWITGLVSPFVGIPDPFFLDLIHSNDPFKSLWVSVGACVLTGLVLMPLDLIKVKLMVTKLGWLLPTDDVPFSRSVRESVRNYPPTLALNPPPSIFVLTTLHQFSQSIFRKMVPYVLFVRFNIDLYNAPNIYTFVNLISLIMELFIKLPVENLLRKEQVSFLLLEKEFADPARVVTVSKDELIVEVNNDEANSPDTTLWESFQRLGLFNGWRVGVLNVVGFWGYNILKSNGGELKEERL